MRIGPPIALWLAVTAVPSWAQVTLDGSLGPAGALIPDLRNAINIEAGMGKQVGSNLFHSFGVFDVKATEKAIFNDTGATGLVENILSRVTGGSSRIDGRITTSFQSSDPNLFLLNPAGVVFGPNAELKVEGSFHASTGDFIELVDGVQFTAMPSLNDALLSAAPPEAFGFLGNNQAGIEVEGAGLQVGSGKSLSVVAPNINVDGGELFAGPAGTVNVASIEGPGEAQIGGGKVSLPTDQSRGRIVITDSAIGDSGTDGSHINIIGGDVQIADSVVSSNSVDAPGRGIEVDADNLQLNRALVRSQALGNAPGGAVRIDADREIRIDSNSAVDTQSMGLGQAGDILISSDLLDMSGSSVLDTSAIGNGQAGNITVQASGDVRLIDGSSMFAEGRGLGSTGGTISLTANRLTMDSGAGITTATFSGEQAGGITLAADTIALTGDPTLITSRSVGSGKAGDINIQTSNLDLAGGAKITGEALALGSGAEILIDGADGTVSLSGPSTSVTSETVGDGDAGSVAIKAGRLTINDSAEISASTSGNGKGGSVNIEATNIELLNGGEVSASTATAGVGGNVAIESPHIRLNSGGTISASTRGSGRGGNIEINEINGKSGTVSLSGPSTSISSETAGGGDAGSVAIKAGKLTVRDGAEISASTRGNGKGGNVTVEATNIELLNGGAIAARSTSPNDSAQSGSLSIRADDTIRIFNDSSINVTTEQADAGNIMLKAGFLLHLKEKGEISTSARRGEGNGGNIFIDPVFTVLDEGSAITARAFRGRGGNIHIATNFLFQSPDSLIDASSEFGVSGNVDIDSPDTDVISGALALPESFLEAASLLSDRCSARAIKGASSFIVSGRGGVPPGPETVLPSQFELGTTPEEVRSHDSTSGPLSNTGLALSPMPLACSAAY